MKKTANADLPRLTPEGFAGAEKMPLVVVLDNVRSALNIGVIFRTCDAFLVESIVLCGICARPPHRDIRKTALGATETVLWRYESDIETAVADLQQSGYEVLAVEQAEAAEMLPEKKWRSDKKYAVVFGNEVDGVSQAVMDRVAGAIEIPQFGAKHSLNVSVSAGLVVWDFFKWWKLT